MPTTWDDGATWDDGDTWDGESGGSGGSVAIITLADTLEAIWDGQLACYDPLTATIGGLNYAIDGGEVIHDDEVIPGGIVQLPSVRIALKFSLLLFVEPVIGAPVVYKSKNYSIQRHQTTPDNTVIIIECEPRNRRQ